MGEVTANPLMDGMGLALKWPDAGFLNFDFSAADDRNSGSIREFSNAPKEGVV